MIVVAFSGKKDAGKDTGANYLAAKYLERVNPRIKPVTFSFAHPLKKFCAQWLGVPLHLAMGTDEDKNTPLDHMLWENQPEAPADRRGPMTVREVLQHWGTDVLRKTNRTIHSDRWKREVAELHRQGIPLVFSADLRFPNEVDAVLELEEEIPGCHSRVVRLSRHPHPGDEHASETALDEFDWSCDSRCYQLNNDGTVADYKRDLLRWFDHTFREQLP